MKLTLCYPVIYCLKYSVYLELYLKHFCAPKWIGLLEDDVTFRYKGSDMGFTQSRYYSSLPVAAVMSLVLCSFMWCRNQIKSLFKKIEKCSNSNTRYSEIVNFYQICDWFQNWEGLHANKYLICFCICAFFFLQPFGKVEVSVQYCSYCFFILQTYM